jgi:hypothetical protein
MNKRILTLAVSILFLMSFAPSQQAKWEKLGSRKINYGLGKDVIPVGIRDGKFTKLKIVVKGGAINMHKMTVHFMNGSSQEIALKHNFTKNSGSRVIDLNGGKRIIKNIAFFYDTKNLARSKATIHVFGRH